MTGLPRRVLALGAHPDDIELSCAGTLARFVEAGTEVHLAVACLGDRGGPDSSIAATRRDEARRSAELLGVPIEFLGFGDAAIPDTPEARDQFTRLIRSSRPNLILTHAPDDYHPDHVRVSELATQCAWFAASPGHRLDLPALATPPAVAYMDNLAGLRSEPTHLVDVTATLDLKRRMLACHESQVGRRDGGVHDLEALAEALARVRGFQCGVTYAEGFRACLLWGRRRPEPLFP
jgi:LmbE family N-acetylglucosaminyl deacetylase